MIIIHIGFPKTMTDRLKFIIDKYTNIEIININNYHEPPIEEILNFNFNKLDKEKIYFLKNPKIINHNDKIILIINKIKESEHTVKLIIGIRNIIDNAISLKNHWFKRKEFLNLSKSYVLIYDKIFANFYSNIDDNMNFLKNLNIDIIIYNLNNIHFSLLNFIKLLFEKLEMNVIMNTNIIKNLDEIKIKISKYEDKDNLEMKINNIEYIQKRFNYYFSDKTIFNLKEFKLLIKKINIPNHYKHDFQNDIFANNYIFKNKKNGYFVEVGSGNGINKSQCYFFEKKLEWQGISVEPQKRFNNELLKNRTNPYFKCLGNENKIINFIESKYWENSGILNVLENHEKIEHHKINWKEKGFKNYEIEMVTLLKMLEEKNSPYTIDLLGMDCEGSEYNILEHYFNNNKNYLIKLIILEVGRDDLIELMIKNNYIELINPYLLYISEIKQQNINFEKYFIHKSEINNIDKRIIKN